MLALSLGTLKYALMLIGAGVGIHGIMNDYKNEGRLTKQIETMVVSAD